LLLAGSRDAGGCEGGGMNNKPLPAGSCGACRKVRGRPLFSYLRRVVGCSGSRIEHLLMEGRIAPETTNFEPFYQVLLRLVRDRPMPAKQFAYAVHRLAGAYRIRDKSFEVRGLPNLRICADQFIGDVRRAGNDLLWVREPRIAAAPRC
jgi:hypothetical protein